MAHAVADQQLLYALRSPTTPLEDKVQRAESALDAEPASTSLPPLVRDWALDYLVRATRSDSGEAALRSSRLWSLLARATQATSSTAANTPPLPIFVAFVNVYSVNGPDVGLLRSAASVWRRIAAVAMRKATVDQALEGYEKLVAASLQVFSHERAAVDAAASAEEHELWQDLGANWLKPLRSMVLDAGKGGKKVRLRRLHNLATHADVLGPAQIPAHTLSLLPYLLPLLAILPSTSPFRASLLETVQLAIFNVENLKRGLARDSYAAGSAEQSAVSTADSELLAALSSLSSSTVAWSYAALPSFTSIYVSALVAHAAVLFPLPAKANFPTPSAQKSALEVLGLTKRRELAGRWIRRVIEYLGWTQADVAMDVDGASAAGEGDKASALAGVLEEVEKADLYRAGQAEESWAGVLAAVVGGAVTRLEQLSQDATVRDALVGVLAIVARLDHSALEPVVPRVLAVLARAPSADVTSSSPTSAFLTDLVTFHSRSVSLPTFLSLLSDASPSQAANNILTAHAFVEQLGHAVSGMTGGATAVRATWENLVTPVRETLAPGAIPAAASEEVAPSPAKKRKLSSSPTPTSEVDAAASRLRVATLFVRDVPALALSSLVELLKTFVEELVDSRLKDFAKASCSPSATAEVDVGTPSKKDKKRRRKSSVGADLSGDLDPEARLGVELLELRYAVVERLSREGLLEGDKWWEIRAKRREGLREVIESGVGESAVEAVRPFVPRCAANDTLTVLPSQTRTLLQHFELSTPSDATRAEAQSVVAAILARIGTPAADDSWTGFLRGLKKRELPVALWELVARRWLPVVKFVALPLSSPGPC